MPTSSPAIHHILSNTNIYVKPELDRKILQNILGDGLLIAEGDTHKRQRKVLNPAFTTGNIRDIVPIFLEKGDNLVNILSEQLKSQTAEGIEVFQFLCRCTLDIIGSAGYSNLLFTADVGFGYEFNSLRNPDETFANAYMTILSQLDWTVKFNIATVYFPFLRKLPFPRVLKASAARKVIVEYATKLVRDKEVKSTRGKDILTLLIAENRNAQGRLAEVELVDQCMTFLLAGHETTSTAVILLELLRVAYNSWRGDYIFFHSTQKYKIVYELQFNICAIRHLNK
jgi:cytochrome P450